MYLKNLIVVILITNLCEGIKYDNYTLINVIPKEADHLNFLQNIEKQKYIDMVFWKRPYKLYDTVQAIVNPTDKELFMERARHFNLDTEILLHDLQKAFDNQTVRRYLRLRTDTFSWENYHELDDVYQWLADLTLQFPNTTELESIGKSSEGRDILSITIKKPGSKYRVIVEGGMHGHEWIATEFVTYLIHQLLFADKFGDSTLKLVANKYIWHIIPILNPDGFDYSHKVDRLWRKNRRHVGSGFGVDLNRNFDYNFGRFESSNDTRDENYSGPEPFSETETKAFANFVRQNKNFLRFYFSFHAYGQKFIIPYADKIKHIENYSEMENYGKQAILKMYKLYRVKYGIGTVYDTMGLRVSGSSASWVKRNFRTKYVFTFLLGDNGTYGFALPSSKILPTCRETLTGLTQLMTVKPRYVRTNIFGFATKIQANLIVLFVQILYVVMK